MIKGDVEFSNLFNDLDPYMLYLFFENTNKQKHPHNKKQLQSNALKFIRFYHSAMINQTEESLTSFERD